VLLLALLAAGAPAPGQVRELTAEDRAYLDRLASARARSDVLRQVRALRIGDKLTVEEWAARSPARDRALCLWVRTQPRYGAARFYGDATCDADVRLDPESLARQLDALREAHPADGERAVSAHELRQAAGRWPILWGSGTAALTEKPRSQKPEGWEDVTIEGIESVKRHAEADARRALLDAAGRLPVTNARRLQEFLDSSEAVRAAVLTALEQKSELKVTFGLDQVAVAEARLNLLDLIRILTDVHQKHYQGELFYAADFRGMALLADAEEVTATGLAFPASQMLIRPPYEPIELDAPSWAAGRLAATGRYTPGDEDLPELAARAEAARLDGVDQLRRQVEDLVIFQNVTVHAFLAEHDELKDDVVLFLTGARVVSAPKTSADGAVEVNLELPMQRLWWILRRGLERIEVYPPENMSTRPAVRSP